MVSIRIAGLEQSTLQTALLAAVEIDDPEEHLEGVDVNVRPMPTPRLDLPLKGCIFCWHATSFSSPRHEAVEL